MKLNFKVVRNRTGRFLFSTLAAGLGLTGALYATGCSVKTPGTETPVTASNQTSAQTINKSFFEEVVNENIVVEPETRDAEGRVMKAARTERRTVRRPKTFLCGWAPISETGFISQMISTHKVQMTGHCNLEFEIQEHQVLGRLINPSFPNDRNRWKPYVAIPISKHYTYERAKDSYGRETNQFVENTADHDWSARPQMTLDLARTTILSGVFGEGGLVATGQNGIALAAQDIEWDREKNFLGFTLNVIDPVFGAENSARFRFNFLGFKHNPEFKKTPYNSQNSRHLNALHVLGEKVDGVSPMLYAARWDMSRKHKIYVHGMPENVLPHARETVAAFNKSFKDIGAYTGGDEGPFELETAPSNRFGFDLRYPSMTWVEDPLISLSSPLGVGMALSDVKNGEILWGNITLFGGYLERYIKSYLPSSGQGGEGAPGALSARLLNILPLGTGFFTPPQNALNALELRNFGITSAVGSSLVQRYRANANSMGGEDVQQGLRRVQAMEDAIQNNQTQLPSGERVLAREEIEALRRTLTARAAEQVALGGQGGEAAARLADRLNADLATIEARSRQSLQSRSLQDLYGFYGVDNSSLQRMIPGAHGSRLTGSFSETIDSLRRGNGGQMIASSNPALRNVLSHVGSEFRAQDGQVMLDSDRRFIDVAPGWAAAIQASRGRIDYDQAYRIVAKELLMHEFGHMVGLGHQFKENILPAEGSIPKKYYDVLKAKAHSNMTNATSVMGYKNPAVEILENIDEVKPGPQDELVLRYLYKQEYATFKPGAEDFTFAQVPDNGIIPDADPEKPDHKTRFFPQCNDYHASLSLDPYCNRFDRGYNAETIVKSYFEDLNDNLVASIYSFTDVRGGNTQSAEGYLWNRALTSMGRVRLFYDYMRQKYSADIERILGNKNDLYEFSRACSGEVAGSATLQSMFKQGNQETELGELCRVNRYAVRMFQNFLVNPGPDQSRMDWDNSYVAAGMTGGDAAMDYSRMFGTRTALSVLPLKYSALNALTTPRPYMFWGSWMFPIPRYDGEQALFSYSSLYPFEYTQTLAATLEKNLHFPTAQTGGRAVMGQSVLAMGYFMNQLMMSNDGDRLPRDYVETIRLQGNFRLSLVAVILKFVGRSNTDVRKTHVETSIYDLQTGRSVTAGESYLLPGGKVIVRGPNRVFIYPVTKLAFINDSPENTQGYVLAYKIDYDKKHDDLLASHSVKTAIEKLHKSAIDACLLGPNNTGLSSFFNAQTAQTHPDDYPGIEVLPGVTSDEATQIRFLNSLQDQFNKFQTFRNKNRPQPLADLVPQCENSLKGLSLLVSSAALLNGYWLPEVMDHLVK